MSGRLRPRVGAFCGEFRPRCSWAEEGGSMPTIWQLRFLGVEAD